MTNMNNKMPRMSKEQKQEAMDRRILAEAGYDLAYAIDFFKRQGIQLSRHPEQGWQFTAVLDARGQACGFWSSVAGSVDCLMEWLDAPSTVIAVRDKAQERIMAREN